MAQSKSTGVKASWSRGKKLYLKILAGHYYMEGKADRIEDSSTKDMMHIWRTCLRNRTVFHNIQRALKTQWLSRRQPNYKNDSRILTDISSKTKVNIFVKRCPLCVIGKVQIKTLRYQHTPTRMARIPSADKTECWWGWVTTGTLIHWWRRQKMACCLWETLW